MAHSTHTDRAAVIASSVPDEQPMTSLVSVWGSVVGKNNAMEDDCRENALQLYDDVALQSLGYDAEDIAKLRKS